MKKYPQIQLGRFMCSFKTDAELFIKLEEKEQFE